MKDSLPSATNSFRHHFPFWKAHMHDHNGHSGDTAAGRVCSTAQWTSQLPYSAFPLPHTYYSIINIPEANDISCLLQEILYSRKTLNLLNIQQGPELGAGDHHLCRPTLVNWSGVRQCDVSDRIRICMNHKDAEKQWFKLHRWFFLFHINI